MNIATIERPIERKTTGGAVPPVRFTALEWLAIAAVSQARPGRGGELLDQLRTLYSQCGNDPERKRLEALAGMAMLIATPDTSQLAWRFDAFLAAGFTIQHLHLLTESLTHLLEPGMA